MSYSGPLLILWMLVLCIVQGLMLSVYVRTLRSADEPLGDDPFPPMLIVLCLRGADPFLRDSLARMLESDYPAARFRIVIDSAEDPALDVVDAFLLERNDARVERFILQNRLTTCSGKVSGLLEATESIPQDCEVIAWIDGDSLLHRSALRELANGLRDPRIGAVSGNRWYLPPEASLSGITRMFWNAFAVPSMNMLGILWGGCMAIRATDFRCPEFRNRLTHSFVEDSAICTYVRSTGRTTRLVASALLLNRETITLKDYYQFATRQLLTVRIDNSRWWLLAAHMLTLNLTILLMLIPMSMPWLPWWKEVWLAYLLLSGLSLTAIPIGHVRVCRTLRARGEEVPRISWKQWLLFPVAVFLPNHLNLASTLNTLLIRQITWRGITYQFSRHKCQIIDVQPTKTSADTGRSII
ncbi:MAG: glycosyltransferase [Planctomycetaceae bacterium]|nr:glycosyltransferase [Planctomycetaceae bacterium]